MMNLSNDERSLDLSNKVSHSTVMWLASIWTSVFLNGHYIIAFNNPRGTQESRTLAQQAFPGKVPYVWEMLSQNHLGTSSCIYIFPHQTFNDYEPIYYLERIRILWFTWTRKAIKHMHHFQWISVDIMTSHTSHRTAKRPRRNQRGGFMALRSGTST